MMALFLISFASAEISKLKADPLANGVIRITFTISTDSAADSYTLLRDGLVLKQGKISLLPYHDLLDDMNTQNKREYNYTLQVKDKQNSMLYQKSELMKADSDYPIIISERKILSRLNTLTIWTNENSFCKAGVSMTQLFPMDGKEKIHSIKLGLVNGLNMVFVICEDSYANMMPNQKIIEYTYDSTPPGQIKYVNILNHVPKRVMLDWETAKDANGIKEYRVYKRILGNIEDELIASANMTSYVDMKNLREGQTYQYSISAVDNADNEGSKSAPKNITIYNTDLLLDIEKEYTTKTGNLTIAGKTIANTQVTAKMDSQVYETASDGSGQFAFKISTERSRTLTVESFDEDGNSRIATIAITRLAPDTEVQKTLQVRESKTNLTYIIIMALIFFLAIFLIMRAAKKRSLYGDIDSYMRERRRKD